MSPDAVDRLLLRELTAVISPAPTVAAITVIDDATGALTLAAGQWATAVMVSCDSLRDERRVRRLAEERLRGASGPAPDADPDAPPQAAALQVCGSVAEAVSRAAGSATTGAGADEPAVPGPVVVSRLPKGLAALDELAEAIAACGPPTTTLLVGGRDKFLTHAMTDVLGSHFTTVRATLGQQKCRALVAQGPLARPITYPRQQRHLDLDLTVRAHGAAFAGTRIDHATRLLLSALDGLAGQPRRVIDLGCGTGVLAVAAARRWPAAMVHALDDSRAAVLSAQATAAANDLSDRIAVRRADGLRAEPAGSADLVVCNPPFHRGTTKDSATAFAMIGDAGRVLRPDGQLWLVYNAHLPYLPALRAHIGPTRIMARDRSYLVTRSVRRAAMA